MGWQPESTIFHCHPSLAAELVQAAKAYGRCGRPGHIWMCMLRRLGASYGLVGSRGRVNLTQLLALHPIGRQLLPDWLLFSYDLQSHLVSSEDQVCTVVFDSEAIYLPEFNTENINSLAGYS
jgi:hypothetical protein